MPARDRWRELVAEACTGFRLDCIGNRPSRYQETMATMLISEVISLRLQIAYIPIFTTLAKIERKLEILANSDRDKWAPKPVRRVMLPMTRDELPEFLR